MIEIPCNFIAVGNSKSSKTVSFKGLYWPIHKRFRHTLLFSSTNRLNCEYNDIIASSRSVLVKEKYDDDLVKEIMIHQENTIIKLNRKYSSFDKIPESVKEKLHVNIICDDMLGLIDFHHSVFNELFAKSRHLYISVFILQQHINTLSPVMRINAHYTLVTKIKDNNIEALYELIQMGEGELGTSKNDLRRFLNKYCVNYQVILFSERIVDEKKNRHYKIMKFQLQQD